MAALGSNLLLESLPAASRRRILALSKSVDLPLRTALYEPEQHPRHAYFITSGVASVVVDIANGDCTEVAVTGREGLVGAILLLGPALTPARCFIQMRAMAYRLPFAALQHIFLDDEHVRGRILEMVQQQSLTMSQLNACSKLHDAEPRLARWFLMLQDLVQESTFYITQEFIAEMLGSSRTTVVIAAGEMQRRGIITYSRGKVSILSRPELEATACDCYAITRHLLNNLYKNFHSPENMSSRSSADELMLDTGQNS